MPNQAMSDGERSVALFRYSGASPLPSSLTPCAAPYIGLGYGLGRRWSAHSARCYSKWDRRALLITWGSEPRADARVAALAQNRRSSVSCPLSVASLRELHMHCALIERATSYRRSDVHREEIARPEPATRRPSFIVDEAERLGTLGLEHLRDLFDRPGSA